MMINVIKVTAVTAMGTLFIHSIVSEWKKFRIVVVKDLTSFPRLKGPGWMFRPPINRAAIGIE